MTNLASIKKGTIEKAILGSNGIKSNVYGKLGIHKESLKKLFLKWPDLLDQLEQAREDANDFVENAMMKRIDEGSDAMTIFYLKTRMRYK